MRCGIAQDEGGVEFGDGALCFFGSVDRLGFVEVEGVVAVEGIGGDALLEGESLGGGDDGGLTFCLLLILG